VLQKELLLINDGEKELTFQNNTYKHLFTYCIAELGKCATSSFIIPLAGRTHFQNLLFHLIKEYLQI